MAAFGYILSAIIAALVGLLTLLVNKDNKVSEFRQEWINGLRDDVSGLITSLTKLVIKKSSLHTNDKVSNQHWVNELIAKELNTESTKFLLDIGECEMEISKLTTLIELRLNADSEKRTEDENKMLILLDKSRGECESNQVNRENVNVLISSIKNCAGKILKTEWEKTKKSDSIEKIKKFLLENKFIRSLLGKSEKK